jgi:OFA family oxalate/formate antiporter-like MFS transporter
MIWAAYVCGVAAGLMAIGHAAGIAATQDFSNWVAASTIASANLVGSILFGWLSDRVSHHSMLTTLPLISAMALIGFSVFLGQTLTLLGILGFAYGGTIAAYPVAITTLFPGSAGPPVPTDLFLHPGELQDCLLHGLQVKFMTGLEIIQRLFGLPHGLALFL